MRWIRQLSRDDQGSVLVEVSVMIPIVFVFLLGVVDFLNAFQQWNAATKAVEVGARLAAVSDPVASGLNGQPTGNNLASAVVANNSTSAGAAMPTFRVVCDGAASTCTCTGTCTGVSGYNAAAMNTLLYGRGNTACVATPTSYYFAGMCNFFPVTAANVEVIYAHDSTDSLGYAGRDDGPVPTITVKLKNVQFQFFFLGGLLNFLNITMPDQATTVTGEGMSSLAQS
jgi:Flp pilus assembly protein TadG